MGQRIKTHFVSVAKIIKRNEPTIKATCFFYTLIPQHYYKYNFLST